MVKLLVGVNTNRVTPRKGCSHAKEEKRAFVADDRDRCGHHPRSGVSGVCHPEVSDSQEREPRTGCNHSDRQAVKNGLTTRKGLVLQP